MRRFTRTRWFAFILALGVLLASSASFPASSMGDSGTDPIAIGDPGTGDPGTKGDPDGPSGPSRRFDPGYHAPSYRNFVSAAGDGGAVVRGWIARVQLVLRGWMSRWTQF